MIKISHLRKEYPNVVPLKDINAEINKGDIIAIIGPSGTGKSTLLRCLNMLETPTSGSIVVDGEDITAKGCRLELLRRKMGMVFQSFNLFNHMNVAQNIMYAPRKLLGLSEKEAHGRAIELLEKVGLIDKEKAYPDELSGGQKQRVAIARALAMEPEILMFDEPTSALDPMMVGEVLSVIRDLARSGMTMLIVTHEMKFAEMVANRVFYMDEGIIYEEGTPQQIFHEPRGELTKRFIRRIKIFERTIIPGAFDFPAFAAELQKFAWGHMMSHKCGYSLQVIIEELCLLTLIPALDEAQALTFSLEYYGESGGADVRLSWAGPEKNPLSGMDEISRKILENAASKIEYRFAEDENIIDIKC